MGRTEIGAISTQFRRPAIAPGRIGPRPFIPDLIERFFGLAEHALDVMTLRVAVEDARQQVVDGDVVRHGLAGKSGDEANEARTRAVGEAEFELRYFHAPGDNVDD